jgi:hypothetical protein
MSQRLLEGNFEEVPIPADDVIRLRREMAGLEHELAEARQALKVERQASNDAKKAIAALRRTLGPIHVALGMVFGEIDTVEAEEFETVVTGEEVRHSSRGKWGNWKAKLPNQQWQVIEALLDHGDMSRQQLAGALHCHVDTVSNLCSRLGKIQLVIKEGGKFGKYRLKET